jgi:hypothetical protein
MTTRNTVQMSEDRHHHRMEWNSSSIHFDTLEQGAVGFKALADTILPVEVIQARRRKEERDLIGMTFLKPHDVKLEEMRGRISGDLAWRAARGELGACATTVAAVEE